MSVTPERCILLVEDNPDDEALTRRAFAKNNITNPVVVAHDGAEALEYLFDEDIHAAGGCSGSANRDPAGAPLP